ncbi:MAG: MBL fold metallo-hydrolase, partial [Chitinophagaceae bacterium]
EISSSLLLVLFYVTTSAQQWKYDIYAVEFDQNDWHPRVSEIAIGSNVKDSLQANFVVWLLRGNNRNILIDAGYVTSSPAKTYQRPDSALQRMGIGANQVSDIILTHPHWDHMGGIHLFPKAMIWLQEADFNYFVNDAWLPGGMKDGFDQKDIQKLLDKKKAGQLTLVKGDSIEIIPGVRVFIGSKHTYESQYVLVNGSSGKTILASDNSWFYANLKYELPIPHYVFDPAAYIAQLKRMKTLVDDPRLIIPGHDADVFKRFPQVAPRVVKIELPSR